MSEPTNSADRCPSRLLTLEHVWATLVASEPPTGGEAWSELGWLDTNTQARRRSRHASRSHSGHEPSVEAWVGLMGAVPAGVSVGVDIEYRREGESRLLDPKVIDRLWGGSARGPRPEREAGIVEWIEGDAAERGLLLWCALEAAFKAVSGASLPGGSGAGIRVMTELELRPGGGSSWRELALAPQAAAGEPLDVAAYWRVDPSVRVTLVAAWIKPPAGAPPTAALAAAVALLPSADRRGLR